MNRAAILTLPVMLASQPIWTCACCADPGFRAETTFQIVDWVADEIACVQVGKTAHLYQAACGQECLRGINELQESYDVSLTVSEDLWEMIFFARIGSLAKCAGRPPTT